MNAKVNLKTVSIIGAAAIAALSLAATGPAAQAYPIGQNLTVLASSTTILTPGAKLDASVKNVTPGCSVFIRFVNGAGNVVDAENDGTTPTVSLKTPSIAGVYTLRASTTSGCSEAETASETIYVGRQTATSVAVSSSSRSAASNPELTVSGRVKFGRAPVRTAEVAITVKGPNGSTKLSATTNSYGKFAVSVKGIAKTSGSYYASVSFAGNTSYIKSSVKSTKFTIRK
jgi:hypothetical protein